MLVALELTDTQIGTLGAIHGLLSVLGYFFSGILAEKANVKKLLIISCIGMAASSLWYATLPDYTSLIIIHILLGFFGVTTFWTPYLKTIRNLGNHSEQGRLFGMSEAVRGVAQTLVAFLCLGVMGLFAEVTMGFRALVLINVAAFVILTILVIFFIPDFDKEKAKESVPEKTKVEESTSKGFIKIFLNSSTWICIFLVFCAYTLWITVGSYMGTYTTRVLHVSPQLSSALSIIRSYIIVVVAGVTGGILMDKFRYKSQGMLTAFLSIAVFGVAMYFTSSMPLLCVMVTIVISYMANAIKSTYWSILGESGISIEDTAAAISIISTIGLSPDLFVPPVISRFIEYGERIGNVDAGFDLMIFWIIAWGLLGVIASIILGKRARKTTIKAKRAY